MSSEKWGKVRLGDISTKITKGTTPTTLGFPFVEEGVNFVKAESVTMEGRIDPSKFVFITEGVHEKLKRSQLEKGDILFSMAGVVLGKTAIVVEEILPANTNQALALIRLNRHLACPEFVHYFLQQKSIFEYVNSMSAQSAQPNINLEEIGGLQISLPPLPTQRRIASILTALDDKIELNRRMNETLEGMAQAVWGEWFGRYASGEVELPEGWRWGVISDLVIHSKESITPSKSPDKEYNHFSLPAFDNNQSPERTIGEDILSNKFKVKQYSILVSKLNPRIPRIWSIGKIDEESAICSTEFQVLVPKKAFYYSFVNLLFQRQEIQEALTARASGTSGSHQRVNPSDILNTEILIPTDTEIQRFDLVVRNFFERKFINNQESCTLTALRDTLLPRLMRGEMEV